jgi:hypothetical protein
MGRMHTPGKGISRSSLPYVRSAPQVCIYLIETCFTRFGFVDLPVQRVARLRLLFCCVGCVEFSLSLLSPCCAATAFMHTLCSMLLALLTRAQWLKNTTTAEEVVEQIVKLAKKGLTPSKIGL